MNMKFQIAAQAAADDEDAVEPITMPPEVEAEPTDEPHVIYMRRPSAAYYALLGMSSDEKRPAATGKFFRTLFSAEDWEYLENRMWDPEDVAVNLESVMFTITQATEKWSGDPTKLSSGSSPSPNLAGKRSTGASKKKVSTPSA